MEQAVTGFGQKLVPTLISCILLKFWHQPRFRGCRFTVQTFDGKRLCMASLSRPANLVKSEGPTQFLDSLQRMMPPCVTF